MDSDNLIAVVVKDKKDVLPVLSKIDCNSVFIKKEDMEYPDYELIWREGCDGSDIQRRLDEDREADVSSIKTVIGVGAIFKKEKIGDVECWTFRVVPESAKVLNPEYAPVPAMIAEGELEYSARVIVPHEDLGLAIKRLEYLMWIDFHLPGKKGQKREEMIKKVLHEAEII